jgi:aldehyde dehydrogenase (NAD+)
MLQQLAAMRQYFTTGATLPIAARKQALKSLKKAILQHEHELYQALYTDLKKIPEECWATELGVVLSEINLMLKNLDVWMADEQVRTNLLNWPGSSRIVKEPLGVVLIIAPWNYPFNLLFTPMAGALAAGNVVVVKPSEFAPATAAITQQIIQEVFVPELVSCVMGEGAQVIPTMMKNFVFDHVFYTGSTAVGKIIYQMAAENLVPVTLELGGKSPAVVEEDADIKVAARRIALPKFSNAGQMCIAPDYVLVHHSKKEAFVAALIQATEQFYGKDPANSYGYNKIINHRQFDRLLTYLTDGKIVYGGQYNREQLYLQPTLLTDVAPDAQVMKEEIFGPILPILTYHNRQEALDCIARNKNPLAFYIFTSSTANEKKWLQEVPAGGAGVNVAALQFTNHHLPFGGRGFSGTGAYHGKASFNLFSHQKSVLKSPTWLDPDTKYPPIKGKLKLLKWVVG